MSLIERRWFLVGAATLLSAIAGKAVGKPAQAFALASGVLYLPAEAMSQRGLPADVLAGYMKSLVAKADEVLGLSPPDAGVSGALVVALKPPARSRIWIVAGDTAREPKLTSLLKGPLEAMPAPNVSGYIAFALNFDSWGGGHRLVLPMPIPDEWRRAMSHSGVLPDDVLKVIWPD